MVTERSKSAVPGSIVLAAFAVGLLSLGAMVAFERSPATLVPCGVLFLGGLFTLTGLMSIEPNEARVLQLFGTYVGTVQQPGLWWVNPFYSADRIDIRARSMESPQIKVNDLDGNPIEIASIVVWRIVETAKASFEVDDVEDYVKIQVEAALRAFAMTHPYDSTDGHSLRGTAAHPDELLQEIQKRVEAAGVTIVDARVSHLAYAPEIAHAMLQRQQASAVVAARTAIVEGAVGMVEMALKKLADQKVVELDDERKATMVSNLLVVLCGDRSTQPVVNTGSLYR